MRSRSFTLNTAEVAGPVLAALVLGAVLLFLLVPHPNFGQANDATTVRIYTSVPMQDFVSIVHGAQMAVDEVNSQAGSFHIELVPLADDKLQPKKKPGDADTYHWDADLELANARRAIADDAGMVYIGTYNSGAAKISLPVLNRVHLAMISPGNTYPGLTKPGTGTAGEPWIYYPLGIQNYFRVVPADDLQGRAAASYAATQLKAKSVYVLDDTELYGHGVAVIFAQAAHDLGLRVLSGPQPAGGSESIDVHADNYTALAGNIVATRPDLVYFGGITSNHPGQMLQDLRTAGYTGAFMGADGIADDTFAQQAQANNSVATGPIVSTLLNLPASQLQGPGADWYHLYKTRYPKDNNEDFAPFGYEAARVAIHGIAQAGKKDREAIRGAIATTTSDDLPGAHILGNWHFDSFGDISLTTIYVQRLDTTWKYQGKMLYDPQAKTWSFKQQ